MTYRTGNGSRAVRLAWLLVLAVTATLALRGAPVVSDPVPITHWGIDEGLSPGPIGAILQTRDGYLWFGSTEGLMRFDGINCKIFDASNTPEMAVSSVSVLYEDRQGRLWVGISGTGGGVVCRTIDGRFSSYRKAEGLENEQIRAIAEDPTGRLWVGTDGGGLFELENGRFRTFPGNSRLPSQFVSILLPAEQGGIWVGSQSRLCRVENGTIHTNLADAGPSPKTSVTLLSDNRGVLWIGSSDGLFKLENRILSKLGEQEELNCCVQSLCFGAEGRMWIGTARGLFRMEHGRFYRTTTDHGLSGNLVAVVYRDREGSIWVANDAPGVDQIRFTRFSSLSVRQGLSHPITTSVIEDRQGDIWIGSHRGVNRYADGSLTHWTTRDGLSANLAFALCEDAQNGMWIGTYDGLNHLVDGKIKVFKREDGLPANIIWCLYGDRSGTVWAGTPKGLVRIADEGFHTLNAANNGLSHNDVRAICEDASGQLWVGTSYGLNRLTNGQFVSYLNATPDRPFNSVLALHADREGDLWIGTLDQGLVRHREGKFSSFAEAEGLFDELVYAILEDDDGFLWMSCDRGIYRVSKKELNAVADGSAKRVTCMMFGKADGLLTTECNGTVQPAAWKSRDGRLWFATTKGVAVIDPGNLPRNNFAPPVMIEEVLLDNKSVSHIDRVQVRPEVNSIEIRYTAMSFVAPELVRFKYLLEGLEADWLPATPNRVARYTHLPAGSYRFRVVACNNDGVWAEPGESIAFVVVPPWWQTRWFITLAVVLFAGTIAGVARFITVRRYRQHMAELARQHELEKERSRIARDMHDVLGADLVKISMLGEIAEEESEDQDTLRPRLQKIVRTARDAVRGMDEIVWAVNPKNDTLENLANYLCQFAREHFELTSTRLHLDVPPNLPDVPLRAEIRHDLFLAAKEALNNAVKHADANDVWLRLEANNHRLRIVIEDNGNGITDKPTGRRGNGLENIRTRITQHGGELKVESRPGAGTNIEILLAL